SGGASKATTAGFTPSPSRPPAACWRPPVPTRRPCSGACRTRRRRKRRPRRRYPPAGRRWPAPTRPPRTRRSATRRRPAPPPSGPAPAELIRARLRRTRAADPGQWARRVADLESERFADRERAERELAQFGDLAGPALRGLLAGNPSAEARRRAARLLAALDGPVTDPERLRELRAVEVLERVGTDGARRLLAELTGGGGGGGAPPGAPGAPGGGGGGAGRRRGRKTAPPPPRGARRVKPR